MISECLSYFIRVNLSVCSNCAQCNILSNSDWCSVFYSVGLRIRAIESVIDCATVRSRQSNHIIRHACSRNCNLTSRNLHHKTNALGHVAVRRCRIHIDHGSASPHRMDGKHTAIQRGPGNPFVIGFHRQSSRVVGQRIRHRLTCKHHIASDIQSTQLLRRRLAQDAVDQVSDIRDIHGVVVIDITRIELSISTQADKKR